MKADKDFYYGEVFKEFLNSKEIQEVGKVLGKGAFGIVKEVRYNNKIYAGKLIERDILEEAKYLEDLKGPNIIKIIKICQPKNKYGKTYQLIIMEKSSLRDLGKLNSYSHDHNILKLKFPDCFDEVISNTVLRYYAKQIVDALEILDRNKFVHFDLKPENILISSNLTLKLTDFSILRKVDDKSFSVDNKKMRIPGGTVGYISPEFYMNESKVTADQAKAQDYYGLGSTLFTLKYGKTITKYKKDGEPSNILADTIVNTLLKKINYIYSKRLSDRDFIIFITNLIQVKPEDRLTFEKIYRNKWLNNNWEYIDKVLGDYDVEEEKLLMELQKQDYFIQKKEIFDFNKEKNENKSIKRNRRKNFKFKKKHLEIDELKYKDI